MIPATMKGQIGMPLSGCGVVPEFEEIIAVVLDPFNVFGKEVGVVVITTGVGRGG